jgi:hypothetical protein
MPTMQAMTNPNLPDVRSDLTPERRALARVGTARRPVKIVEHPTFRAARARLDAGFTVAHLPVAVVNGTSAPSPDACGCATPTLGRSQEAA